MKEKEKVKNQEKGEKEKGRVQGNEKGQAGGAMSGQKVKAPKYKNKLELEAQAQAMKDPETQKPIKKTQQQELEEMNMRAGEDPGVQTQNVMASVLARQRAVLERMKGLKDQETLSDSE